MLAWSIYSAFAGMLILMIVPVQGVRWARGVAALSSLAGLGFGLAEAVRFKADTGLTAELRVNESRHRA